jgi:hypothetical protein
MWLWDIVEDLHPEAANPDSYGRISVRCRAPG